METKDKVLEKTEPTIEEIIPEPIEVHGELSPGELKELKEKHGELFILKAYGKRGHVHMAYLKLPSIDVFATVMAMMDTNTVMAIKTLLINAYVAGDPEVKTNLRLFTSIMKPIQQIIRHQEGEFLEA